MVELPGESGQSHVDYGKLARGHFEGTAEILRRTARECTRDVVHGSELIARALAHGNKVLLCGNGGSAADCQHVAAELVSQFRGSLQRRALPAIALTTDTSFITAFANDDSFEGIFSRQVEALGVAGDVLVAISTSGRSKNVLAALETAKSNGMNVVALTGSKGLSLEGADVTIRIPSLETQVIQECHLAVEHAICDIVERHLFAEAFRPTEEETTGLRDAPQMAR